MYDHLILGATLIDGTGAPGRPADVAIEDGRVRAIGEPGSLGREAADVVDADGLVLCPGFIDPHTHYDAQLLWDPFGSPSDIHGVTTTVNGNCGFTLAPLRDDDTAWTLEMMAEVEGMPLPALTAGVGGDWTTFGEYLAKLDGNLGINAAFLVGHCALRRFVMGESGTGSTATDEQVDEMRRLLAEAIEAGAIGFSSSQSFTHDDGDGHPVPSRSADETELLALCEEVSRHEGTTLEYITDGCLKGFTDDEIERIIQMSLRGQRAVNWNVLTVDSRDREGVEHQLEPSRQAEARGARIVALTMPILVPMNMSFLTRCALTMMPYWDRILTLPIEARRAVLRDAEVRQKMDEAARSPEAGVLARLSNWAEYSIGDTFSDENKPLEGRLVGDIAAERGQEPFDCLVDIVLADDLRTVLWPTPPENDDESWRLRMELIDSGRAMIGGSDGGAHLDRMLGTVYPTIFLADVYRGRKLLSPERAVQLITQVPAQLFGLRDRGEVREGAHADLVLFDPDTIDAGPVRKVADLPADNERLHAPALGIARVYVGGTETVRDGESNGTLAGQVLRSGTDTETVPIPAAV